MRHEALIFDSSASRVVYIYHQAAYEQLSPKAGTASDRKENDVDRVSEYSEWDISFQ